MTAMCGLSANKLGAFRARAIPQFQVTMRRCAMFLSRSVLAMIRSAIVIASAMAALQCREDRPPQMTNFVP